MKLHDLTSPPGSTHRKKIVGRGIGGKGGKTAGRGTKGQKARRQIPAGFEGGQLPLLQRIPKLKGFTNPFRVEYTPVNLDALSALGVSDVTFEVLVDRGLVRKKDLVIQHNFAIQPTRHPAPRQQRGRRHPDRRAGRRTGAKGPRADRRDSRAGQAGQGSPERRTAPGDHLYHRTVSAA